MIGRLRNIIRNYVDIDSDKINPETVIWNLGLTSLDIINIIADCETEFNVYIPEGDIHLLQTVDDIMRYLTTNVGDNLRSDTK